MYKSQDIRRTAVAALGALILSSVAVGSAVGPAMSQAPVAVAQLQAGTLQHG